MTGPRKPLRRITRTASRAGFDLLISFQQLSDDWHADYDDSHKADGLILLGYFVRRSLRSRTPVLDLRLLAHARLRGGVVAAGVGRLA